MRSSRHSFSANSNLRIHRLLAMFIIIAQILPASALRAETVREVVRNTLNSIRGNKQIESVKPEQDLQLQPIESPSERAMRVAFLQLCPRKLTLYVGQLFTLVPLPLDRYKEVVQGISLEWSVVNPEIANVSSCGDVAALEPGATIATARAGVASVSVKIEVRSGPRPVQNDLEWDLAHSKDCSEELSQLDDSHGSIVWGGSFEKVEGGSSSDQAIIGNAIKVLARPTMLPAATLVKNHAIKAGRKIPRGEFYR